MKDEGSHFPFVICQFGIFHWSFVTGDYYHSPAAGSIIFAAMPLSSAVSLRLTV